MSTYHPYMIFNLGDQGLLIEFGDEISRILNDKVLYLFHQLKAQKHSFITDLIPAYNSLAIYYDLQRLNNQNPHKSAFDVISELVEEMPFEAKGIIEKKRQISIPVCYDAMFAPDLEELAFEKKLSVNEVIHWHTSTLYHVYMIGFLPGFAYMGEVNDAIATPRKSEPRISVPAGSVGIAGKQTGIYPVESPGGWQLIGRTPLSLFNKERTDPVLLQPGDEIQFYSITPHEFEDYQSRFA